MHKSQHDLCLFISDAVIGVQYVDVFLFWSQDSAEIIHMINGLRLIKLDLEEEGDTSGYLGVKLQNDPKTGEIILT